MGASIFKLSQALSTEASQRPVFVTNHQKEIAVYMRLIRAENSFRDGPACSPYRRNYRRFAARIRAAA
jgi:hypothetical protein